MTPGSAQQPTTSDSRADVAGVVDQLVATLAANVRWPFERTPAARAVPFMAAVVDVLQTIEVFPRGGLQDLCGLIDAATTRSTGRQDGGAPVRVS